jgi:hypothetical protein
MGNASLDFRPQQVDILCAAGDSVSFNVHVVGIENLTTPVFSGQVRAPQDSVVEEFTAVPTATGATLVLDPTQTRMLMDVAGQQRVVGAPAVSRCTYDVQLEHSPGVVRTLIRGRFTIEEDVTRDV